MSQTIKDVPVGDTWINLNTTTSIAVGTAMAILNKAPHWVLLAEGAQPSADSTDGIPLRDMRSAYANSNIPSGSLTIWAKSLKAGKAGLLSVQPL